MFAVSRGSLFLTLVLLCGCNGRSSRNFSDPAEMERYAALPFATATHHEGLRAELARVVTEHGTPEQIAVQTKALAKQSSNDSRHNVIAELKEIFPLDTRERLAKRLETIYPDATFRFAPLVHTTIGDLLQVADDRQHDYQRLMSSATLERVHLHARGLAADTDYLDAVEVGNRLLGLTISEHLATKRIPQAVDSLDVMFRAAEWLARERHPAPRVAAAQRRAEAFAALGAIARHPDCSSEILAKLQRIVDRQLSNWPPDADAWIGERAEGLHTYELVRDGYLLSVLPFEQLRKFRDLLGIDKLGQIVAANLDGDELFFLTTMRKLIDSCSVPFYQRTAVFAQIDTELEKLRSSDEYPLIADQLLLLEIAPRQREIALDRARCEAWHIALLRAAGSDTAVEVINPVTGKPFSIVPTEKQVTVGDIGDDDVACVPSVP